MRPRDAFAICHEIYEVARELVNGRVPTTQVELPSKFLWRPDLHPRLVEYLADFARAGERALEGRKRQPRSSSRLILFRMYFLGGAEYEAARRTMGISERTWADWADEIRDVVGRELLRAGICPPARYFRETSPRRVRR